MGKLRRAHMDLDYAADCVLALMGEEAEDPDARVVGARLAAEALLAMVGWQLKG